MRTYFLCAAFLICGVVGGFSQRSSSDSSSSVLSSNPKDLVGVWEVWGRTSRSEAPTRRFEFLPDGTAYDTWFFRTSDGDSSERRRRDWKQVADRILITGASSSQTVEIRVPFDLNNLELTEITTNTDSTRTTTMKASRASEASSNDQARPQSHANQNLVSSDTEAELDDEPLSERITSKVAISKQSRKDNWYQNENVSLNITLRNTDLKLPTGPLKLEFWILAKNLENTRQVGVLQKSALDAAMGVGLSDKEFKAATDPIMNRFYNYSNYRNGFEANGWIIRVTNRKGKIVALEASRPEWKRSSEALDKLEKGRVYTNDLKLIEGDRMPYYGF